MNEVLNALIILATPACLGYIILSALFKKSCPLPFYIMIAIGYGLGCGIIAQWCFFLGLVKIPLTSENINIPIIFLTVIIYFLFLKKKVPYDDISHRKEHIFDIWSIILKWFICTITAYVFWRCLNIPVYAWDAISTHSFNAKVFYFEKSLAYYKNMPHSEYPLHLPLLEAWFCITLGAWNDQHLNLLFSFYFLSLIFIVYFFLVQFVQERWALLGIFLIISSGLLTYHATIAYRDFTILYYNILPLLFILLWAHNRNDGWLYTAGLFSGFCSFIKLEGVSYLILHASVLLLILYSMKEIRFFLRLKNFLRFALPAATIFSLFFFYSYTPLHPTHNNPQNLNANIYNINILLSAKQLTQLLDVLRLFYQNMFFSNNWNLLWLLFTASLLNLFHKRITREIKHLLIALALYILIYVFIYSFTQHYFWISKTSTTLSRSILHFFPIIPILIILLNFSSEKTK